MVYDVIGNRYGPFFDIFLHGFSPKNVFYIILEVGKKYAQLGRD